MMDVYCNQFVQICPANYGQWHNTITLDIEKPNTLVLNEETYQSRWTCTMSRDGQWNEISFTFSRHHHHGEKLWTEHYTRIGPEIWSLLHRSQIPQQHHHGTAYGSYDARGYCPTRGLFWNAAEESQSNVEEEAHQDEIPTYYLRVASS